MNSKNFLNQSDGNIELFAEISEEIDSVVKSLDQCKPLEQYKLVYEMMLGKLMRVTKVVDETYTHFFYRQMEQ